MKRFILQFKLKPTAPELIQRAFSYASADWKKFKSYTSHRAAENGKISYTQKYGEDFEFRIIEISVKEA